MRLPRMDTAQLTLVRQPFDNPEFLFELKHDGFRALAYISDGHCELVSRRRNSYKSFRELRSNLARLKVKNAVLDGELVCLDSNGRSIFNELLLRKGCPIFYAFDLLYLNDRDIRQLPLVERKQKLRDLIEGERGADYVVNRKKDRNGTWQRLVPPTTMRVIQTTNATAYTVWLGDGKSQFDPKVPTEFWYP